MNQQSILSDILANIFDVFIAVHKYIKEFEDNLAEKNFVVDKNNEEKINTFIENLF